MNYIKDTSVISKNKRSFSISENFLLALPCGNNVSNRDNIIIKEALVEFLHKADRTIQFPFQFTMIFSYIGICFYQNVNTVKTLPEVFTTGFVTTRT